MPCWRAGLYSGPWAARGYCIWSRTAGRRWEAHIQGAGAPGSTGPNAQMHIVGFLLGGQARGLDFRRIPEGPSFTSSPPPLIPNQPLCSSLLGSLQLKSVSGLLVSVFPPGLTRYSLVHGTSSFTLPSSSAPCGLTTPPPSARAPGNQPPASHKLGFPGWQLEKEGREAYG